MATDLDLEEQEQLDALKSLWARWGNLVTWVLIVVLGAYAAWNAWDYWQRHQGAQASALFAEVERSAAANDVPRLQRSLSDMKSRFGGTTYATHAALLAARIFEQDGKSSEAEAELAWASGKAADDGLRAIAALRLASLQMGAKQYDAALQTLAGKFPPQFSALVADRRGDVLLAQGKRAEAAAQFSQAYRELGRMGSDYRHVVAMKLNALGVDPDNLEKAAS